VLVFSSRPREASVGAIASLTLLTVLSLFEGHIGRLTAEFQLCGQFRCGFFRVNLYNLLGYVPHLSNSFFAVKIVRVLQLDFSELNINPS